MTNNISAIREVADRPRVTGRTLHGPALGGGYPAFEIGGVWRFLRSDLDRWTQSRSLSEVGQNSRAGRDRRPGK